MNRQNKLISQLKVISSYKRTQILISKHDTLHITQNESKQNLKSKTPSQNELSKVMCPEAASSIKSVGRRSGNFFAYFPGSAGVGVRYVTYIILSAYTYCLASEELVSIKGMCWLNCCLLIVSMKWLAGSDNEKIIIMRNWYLGFKYIFFMKKIST